MTYVVCYSGGHTSAICAIECVRRYGKENVILLNHDITGEIAGVQIEPEDVKRFKREVAEYLGLPITYVNSEKYGTPLDVILDYGIIHNPTLHTAICTYYLKTLPFCNWLAENFPTTPGVLREDVCFIYGFDKHEENRITKKIKSFAKMHYVCEFPGLYPEAEKTIHATEEIGITRPNGYMVFNHANCIGCLKAGRQHWYAVYCLFPTVYEEYAKAEAAIGYTIIKHITLRELAITFEKMKRLKIEPTEKTKPGTFWAAAKKKLKQSGELTLFALIGEG